jgi:hypothetical protein
MEAVLDEIEQRLGERLTPREQEILATIAETMRASRKRKTQGRLIFELDLKDGGVSDCHVTRRVRV